MTEVFVLLGFVPVIAFAIWYVTSPLVLFRVKVADGVLKVSRGKVGQPFLAVIREVCEQHGVRAATISGVAAGKRIALRFSASLPAAGQQQVRNWWVNSGWSGKL